MHALELFHRRFRRRLAQQVGEFRRLQRGEHGAQAFGAFRVIGAVVVLQAGRMGDQRGRHVTPPSVRRLSGAAADDEAEHAGFLAPGQQGVAGFAAEGLEVGDGGAVGRQHAQPRAGRQGAQRAVGPQHRQRAVHALHVQQSLAHGGRIVGRGRAGGKAEGGIRDQRHGSARWPGRRLTRG